MRELLARVIDWLRRDRLDAELREELAFHREQLARAARAAGAPPSVADSAARRRLGNTTRAVEAARERWSIPLLDQLQQDVRYALRGLRKSPGFTFAVVATLALGIGANAAMFGIIDRLMFRPHAFLRDPDRVHRVYTQYTHREQQINNTNFEYTSYLDLRKWSTAFSEVAAFFDHTAAIGVGDASRELPVAAVSASFFRFFDAPPVLGRYVTAAEDTTPRGASVAVLSYPYWQSEYGGRDVLGESIQIGSVVTTIIGVAPEGFNGVFEENSPVLYWPITTFAGSRPGETGTTYFVKYNWGWTEMMVRRKDGVSVEVATADLTNAYVRSWNAAKVQDPDLATADVAKPRAVPGPLKTAAGPDPGLEARTLLWVGGVAGIVLLIACANAANLFLARALRRRREVALRLALGVSKRRLVAQSLTESLVLALLGCSLGIFIAQWGGLALRRAFVGRDATFDLLTDGRTLAVALAAAIIAALITGLAPVFLAGRNDVAATLKAGSREGTYQRSRARGALLILQGTMSVVLLVGAGLFVRSLQHVRDARMGYDPEPVLLVIRNLRGTSLPDSESASLGRRLLSSARALPEVEAATWVSSLPFWSTSSTNLFVEGIDSVSRLGRFTYQTATTDYFAATGTRILKGRGFSGEDDGNSPRIAIVSEGMARTLWPGREAIGQCMRVSADTMPCTTVVGIAEDANQRSLVEETRYRYYLPLEQHDPTGGFALMLRMRGDAGQASEGVRKALQRVMPGQTYVTVRQMRDMVHDQRRSWRLGATMFAAFGGLALVVAAVGLYGVIAYNVAQRLHEIGVRVALGARRGDVIRLVVGQGLRYATAGVATGSVIALVAAGWIEPLLFRQPARDPAVFAGVGGVLLIVALLASAFPAVRATRVDPNSALRSD
jgi:predicted permease